MNWNQLQYIVTTAQEKSITKAAKKLFISQPSLTLSIQNLEKELGVELFERNRGSLALTYAGQLYYDWALSTLHARERLSDRTGARSCSRSYCPGSMRCSPQVRSSWKKSRHTSCERFWKKRNWTS